MSSNRHLQARFPKFKISRGHGLYNCDARNSHARLSVMLRFRCPTCGKKRKCPAEHSGKKARCSCGQLLVLPIVAEHGRPAVISSSLDTPLECEIVHGEIENGGDESEEYNAPTVSVTKRITEKPSARWINHKDREALAEADKN